MPLPPVMLLGAAVAAAGAALLVRRRRLREEDGQTPFPAPVDDLSRSLQRLRRQVAEQLSHLGALKLNTWQWELLYFAELRRQIADLNPDTPALWFRYAPQGEDDTPAFQLKPLQHDELLRILRNASTIHERDRAAIASASDEAELAPARELEEKIAALERERLRLTAAQAEAEDGPRQERQIEALEKQIHRELARGGYHLLTWAGPDGLERFRLVPPAQRSLWAEWQDHMPPVDLAEVAAFALDPASALAQDARCESATLRWLMGEEPPAETPLTILGGLALGPESRKALADPSAPPTEGPEALLQLRAVRAALRALSALLQEVILALELLRPESNEALQAVRMHLNTNSSYARMDELPLPGAAVGPRILVHRSHHLAKALWLLATTPVLDGEGKIKAEIVRAVGISKAVLKAQP